MINNQCQFEPSTNTSSATTCKWCGQEKWQHNKTIRNNKQTAVEYLVEQLERIGFSTNNIVEFENEVLIAKEIQKEQIVKAAQDNFYAGQDLANGYKIDWNSAKQYYNKTYGKE